MAKNTSKSASSPIRESSASSPNITTSTALRHTESVPQYSVFDVRKKGLEQVQFIHDLYYNTPRPVCNVDIESILAKYNTAANQYLNKGVKCGFDCYTFAESFFTQQIQDAKREKTRCDYLAAKNVLPFFGKGKSHDEIMNAIVSFGQSQPDDARE